MQEMDPFLLAFGDDPFLEKRLRQQLQNTDMLSVPNAYILAPLLFIFTLLVIFVAQKDMNGSTD